MKKLILVYAAVLISVCVFAQTDTSNGKRSPIDFNRTDDGMNQNRNTNNTQNQHLQINPVDKSQPDGVMMQNGKMMMIKNGKATILDHDMPMNNGSKIMSDGTFIKKDGTKLMMKDGQHIDMSGNMVPMKTNKDRNMYLVPDSTKNKDY